MALCFDRGVLPVPLLWHAHRSAAVSSVYDGRRTICLTVAKQWTLRNTCFLKQVETACFYSVNKEPYSLFNHIPGTFYSDNLVG